MSLSDVLLPEFDHEMALTRRVLERVPEDRFDWQPHPKSMTLGRLATHVAEAPSWAVSTMTQDSIDVEPVGGPGYEPKTLESRQAILALLDESVASARAAIGAAEDATFGQPWSLMKGGEVVMTMPRAAVLRSFVLNHNVHHRAQLGVYLRMLEVPLPMIYGPSADEEM